MKIQIRWAKFSNFCGYCFVWFRVMLIHVNPYKFIHSEPTVGWLSEATTGQHYQQVFSSMFAFILLAFFSFDAYYYTNLVLPMYLQKKSLVQKLLDKQKDHHILKQENQRLKVRVNKYVNSLKYFCRKSKTLSETMRKNMINKTNLTKWCGKWDNWAIV